MLPLWDATIEFYIIYHETDVDLLHLKTGAMWIVGWNYQPRINYNDVYDMYG